MVDKSVRAADLPLADLSKTPDPHLRDMPIHPDRYYSADVMKQEWDKVWTRTWQIAGLARELGKSGDFITMDLGRENILCVRADDGLVRAFYNVCQHRGMQLMAAEAGHAPRLTCPYHGWAYDLKGKLKLVPEKHDFAQGNPCEKQHLVEIRCEVWAGFIWFNMDEDAPTLREYLGPIADQIETYPMEDMVRTHWVTLEGDFNWKLVQDNFSESYHVPFVHPETKYVMEFAADACQFNHYPEGHCRMLMPGATPAGSLRGGERETIASLAEELEFWDLNPADYAGGKTRNIRADLQRQKRKLGAEKGFDFSRYHDSQLTDHWHYTIFPNLSFSLKPDGNIWLRARPHESDPERCYFDMWYMTLFPVGQDSYYSQTMKEWVSISTPAPHIQGPVDQVSAGPAIDQDVAIWSAQQRGLHSRGYRRDYLAGQESRLQYFHQHMDDWLKR